MSSDTQAYFDAYLDKKIDERMRGGNGHIHEKDPHSVLERGLPRGQNFAKCEGNDCGHRKLTNPTKTTSFKTCKNCDANTVPKTNDYCSTCGFESDVEDDWDDSDVDLNGGAD